MAVDPAAFGDPLATQVSWAPCRSGGAGFRTHRLVHAGPGRIEFRPRIPWAFLVVLAAVALAAAVMVTSSPSVRDRIVAVAALVLVAAVGGVSLWITLRPGVFDRASGQFWRGWQRPAPGTPDGRSCRLADVHALQLLGEHVRSKNSFWSYELNLVLRDGRRLNVTDHARLEALRGDAAALAQAFGWALWDATARD